MTRRVRIQRSRPTVFKQIRSLCNFSSTFLGIYGRSLERQRKIDLDTEKLLSSQQKRKIGELEEGIRANKLLLLDIQIEQKKLELLALQRKLGNPDDFAPSMTERN